MSDDRHADAVETVARVHAAAWGLEPREADREVARATIDALAADDRLHQPGEMKRLRAERDSLDVNAREAKTETAHLRARVADLERAVREAPSHVWDLPDEPEDVAEIWDRDGNRYRLDRETDTWKTWIAKHCMWAATDLDWVDLLLTRAPLSDSPPKGGTDA